MVLISATMSNIYRSEGHRRSMHMGERRRENGGQVRLGKVVPFRVMARKAERLKTEKHSHNASAYLTYEARNYFL